ncbi:MAG: molybdopterin-guanine dinucleotide biosynthesis protein B [Desulfobacterales bacterium]|nr:MAG: molybdopterin-guanine dinucleotide biosynthesis protein B [Desulfobacterales bacterium]
MSPPILLIVGRSNSGKTTLTEKLIRELTSRGVSIGSVKHTHEKFEFDKKGKDSWRHKQAGASASLVVTDSRVALVRDDERSEIEKIKTYLKGVDLILAEGFKTLALPKIEIFRTNSPHDKPICLEDTNLKAFVTDSDFRPDVPIFGLEDINEIANLIQTAFLTAGE